MTAQVMEKATRTPRAPQRHTVVRSSPGSAVVLGRARRRTLDRARIELEICMRRAERA